MQMGSELTESAIARTTARSAGPAQLLSKTVHDHAKKSNKARSKRTAQRANEQFNRLQLKRALTVDLHVDWMSEAMRMSDMNADMIITTSHNCQSQRDCQQNEWKLESKDNR